MFGRSITCNLITRIFTFYNMKLTQSTALEQEHLHRSCPHSSPKTRHSSCEKRDKTGTRNVLLSGTVVLFIFIQGYEQELFHLDMYGQTDSVGDGLSVKVLYNCGLVHTFYDLSGNTLFMSGVEGVQQ